MRLRVLDILKEKTKPNIGFIFKWDLVIKTLITLSIIKLQA